MAGVGKMFSSCYSLQILFTAVIVVAAAILIGDDGPAITMLVAFACFWLVHAASLRSMSLLRRYPGLRHMDNRVPASRL